MSKALDMSRLKTAPPRYGFCLRPALRVHTVTLDSRSLLRAASQNCAARLTAFAVERWGRYANCGVLSTAGRILSIMSCLISRASVLPRGSCKAMGRRLATKWAGLWGLGNNLSQHSVQAGGIITVPGCTWRWNKSAREHIRAMVPYLRRDTTAGYSSPGPGLA